MYKISSKVTALVLGACMSFNVSAVEILIDLSNLVSTTAGNWNNISSLNGATAGLIDSTGAATGISISGSGWSDFFGDDTLAFGNVDWVVDTSAADGAGLSASNSGSFIISGLTGSSYTVELLSARTSFDYLNFFTVDSLLADRTFNGTPVNDPWGSTSDGLALSNWLIWDALSPVANTLNIDLTASSNTLGILNAIRISDAEASVPVPTTLALFGLGLAGLRFARKRKV